MLFDFLIFDFLGIFSNFNPAVLKHYWLDRLEKT